MGSELRTRPHVAPTVDICPLSELPPGAHRVVETAAVDIGVVNVDGELFAIEDRCSHDDGLLFDGPVDAAACTVECPRHGSVFDLRTGRPLNLPAYAPVETFPVVIEGDMIRVEVD